MKDAQSISRRIERLGGKAGALRYLLYRAAAACGGFASLRRIDASRVERLVLMCTGNVCRSPYAEQRLRQAGHMAVSCGTATSGGTPANSTAVRIAAARGVDMSSHASIRAETFAYAATDLIVAMEPAHLRRVASFASSAGAQVTLLGLWCNTPTPYIPDPYGRSDACFDEVFAAIDQSVACLSLALKAQTNPLRSGEPSVAP